MAGADSGAFDVASSPNMEKLTEEERVQLRNVMARAKEVEQQEQRRLDRLRQPLEGQLFKWTNVMKGWQSRWFYLDPTASVLYYYMSEERKRGPPRGSIMLDGAVIAPSDDDSQSFAISATNGENFRLRAVDAKERQSWVMRLRQVVQHLAPQSNAHSSQGVYVSGASSVSSFSARHDEVHARRAHVTDKTVSGSHARSASGSYSVSGKKVSMSTFNTQPGSFSRTASYCGPAVQATRRVSMSCDMAGVGEVLELAEGHLAALTKGLDSISSKHSEIVNASSDKDLLMFKAVAQATLSALSHCHNLMFMQIQHRTQQLSTAGGLPPGASIEWLRTASTSNSAPPSPGLSGHNSPQRSAETSPSLSSHRKSIEVSIPDRAVDDSLYEDSHEEHLEIETDKQRKSVILHLLSQLKLGMDLSRVVLPTFILERRSLLEMYGDFLSHPEMFASIADGKTAEDRMVRVVKFFVTSFCAGRRGPIARKPYNPILGEFFECSFRADTSRLTVEQPDEDRPQTGSEDLSVVDVTFISEQVSHHPPISAFYAECPSKRLQMNGDVWTKSRFLGMSVGVHLEGEVCISVLEHDEEYRFTLPSAFARSVLTVPWLELGGRINIVCEKSGYQSFVTFHTKPLYGGKPHKISGDIRHQTSSSSICKIAGEWNDKITLTFEGKDPIILDSTASTARKIVKPISEQGEFESRRLWRQVTLALKTGDIQKATDEKKSLEERQRSEVKERESKGIDYRAKLFHHSNQRWLYNDPLTGR